MNKVAIGQFDDFFAALHGHAPFPWQVMLLERVAGEGWPDLIDLPTASGKTACIDVGLFALAMGVPTPRRIWFVVDRRIVVDEAYARATKISVALRYAQSDARSRVELAKDQELGPIVESIARPDSPSLRAVACRLRELGGSKPLEVGRLRGGAPRAIAWAGNPVQPAVVTSTIDQIGSRLLFRGYGVSDHARPLHAALAGNDSLIILDEAHLARPFAQTLAVVEEFRREPWASQPIPTPFKLVVMSATPPGAAKEPIRFPSDAEFRRGALDHPLLLRRMRAMKPTQLAIATKPKPIKGKRPADGAVEDELVLDAAQRAVDFAAQGRRRIAVMVNRVATARQIVTQLQQTYADVAAAPQVELMTGRLRPVDRDELVDRLAPALRSGSQHQLDRAIILVTTQCLEVGADFSFDVLISECASLDALRQRFGRLSRLGEFPEASGVILIRKQELTSKTPDPIYGDALAATWTWLCDNADATAPGKTICMGIEALRPKLPQDLSPYLARPLDAPILLPAYLDLLCQTSPRPAVEPDISLFLHGIPPADQRPRAQVQVLWRDDLELAAEAADPVWEELVVGLPPLPGEKPLSELRRLLLEGDETADDAADVEGGFELSNGRPSYSGAAASTRARFVVWRGRDACMVTDEAERLRPDDVVVFPSGSPTARALLPQGARADVYEAAYRAAYGVVRKLYRATALDQDGEVDQEAAVQLLTDAIAERDRGLFRSPQMARYADGFYHFTPKMKVEPVDRWETDIDEDDRLYESDPLGLEEHTGSVVAAVAHLSRTVPAHAELLAKAAELHDVGKADPRFQHVLHRRRWIAGGLLKLRAKSGLPKLSWSMERRLREAARLPEGFRHELLSMQMADAGLAPRGDGMIELLLHLIASHHGRCRPFAPVVIDDEPKPIACTTAAGDMMLSSAQRINRPPHRLDSGVAPRFWALTRRYGWWGLAYLEAMLRCADIHASAYAEQEAHR